MTRSRAEWLAAIAVVTLAGAVFLARVPAFPLLGFDSYPEILTSRILDLDDFIGTFTEQTSEDFYPSAFYRPVLNLSLAADYALKSLLRRKKICFPPHKWVRNGSTCPALTRNATCIEL